MKRLCVLLCLAAIACGGQVGVDDTFTSQEAAVSQCSGSMPPPSCDEPGPRPRVDAGTPAVDAGNPIPTAVDAGTGTTTSTIIVEPQFNGGFDDRFMGKCDPQPDGSEICVGNCYPQPGGGTACDAITARPYGWWVRPPHEKSWNSGINAGYADGRTYSPPHPHFPLYSSNSMLNFIQCVTNSVDPYKPNMNCAGSISIVSPLFDVEPGQAYKLSYWVRSSRLNSATFGEVPLGLTVNVHWYKADLTFLSITTHQATPDVAPRMDWVETGRLLSAPAGAWRGAVEVEARKLDRFAYVDDVRLIPQ